MPLLETRGAASVQGFGALAASARNYIEDVFSTYLYTGNGSTQTITNGIDLSGKGGLVWTKRRNSVASHRLQDTVRGLGQTIYTDATAAQANEGTTGISGFLSSGYSLGSLPEYNESAATFASWTFRKQAKFFDVVTYTGTSSAQTINHSLGASPGMVVVKRTDSTGTWAVWHRSLPAGNWLKLNLTDAQASQTTIFPSDPTASTFTVGTNTSVNTSGGTYVAYLFAHDAGGFGASGSDNVITCGSYTGNGSATGPTITLGYEPQWLLIKRTDLANDWFIIDNMRGLVRGSGGDNSLFPNLTAVEDTNATLVGPTATGFVFEASTANVNASGGTYIYIAIRRGPMKTPTTGTSVFAPVTFTGTTGGTEITSGFITDLVISDSRTGSTEPDWVDRLRGGSKYLASTTTAAEGTFGTGFSFDRMTGVRDTNYGGVAISAVDWCLRRAPGFFDEVCYTGTGGANVQNHNLGVAPELVILKSRSTGGVGYNWPAITNTTVSSAATLLLNNTTSTLGGNSAGMFTSTTINLGNTTGLGSLYGNQANQSGVTFVAYLFASLPGISKVGSYTGSGTTKQIDCGFTGGARFVLIKRADSTGDWYVWDSARGIVAGNDPYLLLNSTAAEVTSTDYVDTYSAGFEISSTAPAAINANGGSFIFLAIA